MSNYIKDFTETFNYAGDTITMTLRQIKRGHALELVPLLNNLVKAKSKINEKDDEDQNEQQVALVNASNKFTECAARIIKDGKYVKNITGLTIDGVEVKPDSELFNDTVLEDFYFTGLVGMIASTLVSKSTMQDVDEKKLEEQFSTTTDCTE